MKSVKQSRDSKGLNGIERPNTVIVGSRLLNVPRLLCGSSDTSDLTQKMGLDRLGRIVMSESATRQTRVTAASQLARAASQCVRALQRSLTARDEIVRGEAAAGIAGIIIGSATAEPCVATVNRLPRGLGVLLSHASNNPIPLPKKSEYARVQRTLRLRVAAPSQEEFESASDAVASNRLPLRLSIESAWKIECQGVTLFFLPTVGRIDADVLKRAISRNSIAGVIIRRGIAPSIGRFRSMY